MENFSMEKFRTGQFPLENAKDAIFWIDPETGLIISCNKSAEILLEKKKKEIIGCHQATLYSPQKTEYYAKIFKKHIEQDKSVDEEAEVLTNSGKIKPVHITAFITSVEGKPVIQGIFHDITKRKEIENALREREERLRSMFELSGIGMALVKPGGQFLKVNRSLCEIVGYSEKELLTMNFQKLTHTEDLSICVPNVEKMLRGEIPYYQIEERFIHKRGYVIWILFNASLVRDAQGQPQYYVFQVQDITDSKKAEIAIKDACEFAENIIGTIREPLLVLDSDLRIILANHSFSQVFKVTLEETTGQYIYDLGNRQWDIPKLRKLLEDILPMNAQFNDFEVEHEFPAIGRKIMLLNARKIYREPDKKKMILLAIEDITKRKGMEKVLKESKERFKYMSFHDELTGLYNRAFFMEEMERFGKDFARSTPVSIISIDIDGLKLTNDTFGHKAGDELLIKAAKIISTPFRKVDIIARIGGDEFYIILPNTDHQAALERKDAIAKLVVAHNEESSLIQINMSIGVATSQNVEGENIYDIYRRADESMYGYKLIHTDSPKSNVIEMLLKALSERDFIAQGHSERLSKMAEMIADRMNLSHDERRNLLLLTKVHDLGKVGIPDNILFKPSKLSEEEYEKMKEHVQIGQNIASRSKELFYISNLILHHHEFWDGNGYSDGLKGEQIPLECRIFSIMDAYDAMTDKRPYRQGINKKEAIEELRKHSGTQFEPRLVYEFVKLVKEEQFPESLSVRL
jgi:diguanylate cyclase (GGDEF)-like protein/PAS domain S-box-containing protein